MNFKTILFRRSSSQVCQVFNAPPSTCWFFQAHFGTQAMLDPQRLVNKDLGTQIALGRVVDDFIILPAPIPSEGLLKHVWTLLTNLGLEVLPFGHSLPMQSVPFLDKCSKFYAWCCLMVCNHFFWSPFSLDILLEPSWSLCLVWNAVVISKPELLDFSIRNFRVCLTYLDRSQFCVLFCSSQNIFF